jgi:ankyrin repeat protein
MIHTSTRMSPNAALADAIFRRDLSSCRHALECGADPRAYSHDAGSGDVMLTYAISLGFTAGARLLLKSGAGTTGSPCGRRLPLLCAAEAGDLALARELIKQGVDVKAANTEGWTALHHAARRGDVALIKLLNPGPREVHAMSKAHKTPMHLAAKSTYGEPIESLRALIAAGGSSSFVPEAPTLGYMTPFQLAVRYGADEQVSFFLRECGEDPAQLTLSGRDMIDLAGLVTVEELLRAVATETAVETQIAASAGWAESDIGAQESFSPSKGLSPL